MTETKQTKTRIPEFDKQRFKKALGDTSITDFLKGVIYDYLDGEMDEQYYENVGKLRELEGEKAEVEGRLSHVEERIEELEGKRERLERRRGEIEEEMEEIVGWLEDVDEDTVTNTSGVDDVAYDLLVEVANGEIGTNGVISGVEAVQRGAVRAEVDPEELIEKMKEMTEPALDFKGMEYVDDPIKRSFRTDNSVQPVSTDEFDLVRRAIAEEVVDDDDLDGETDIR